jgi:hypothetical protein
VRVRDLLGALVPQDQHRRSQTKGAILLRVAGQDAVPRGDSWRELGRLWVKLPGVLVEDDLLDGRGVVEQLTRVARGVDICIEPYSHRQRKAEAGERKNMREEKERDLYE